ncbi:MAG TPA: T9SS type A sorting domain-containing protein [candidate division WOR-3 bacterium]|uniref:T9SS type A sorting domain-containing protein n=1 Tax=candidate division WOR-3 bacterium TaxID=2052148 RepID=A0A7V0T720_UNCW3|nr:T9SS type A sorting domain-containing protein [candidate division WOR-3 bacterium]
MGDSVVVVWEERHSPEDSDIRASVEFEAGFTVVDNEGRATYPFAVFQNKASGDSAMPLLHVIHSDAPQENYYEVGYAVRNLKTGGGGGQQSGGNVGPHIRPELAACRPNPFSRLTQIRYQFPREGEALLRVYDASGRVVRTLAEGRHKPGVYTVTWDGTDARGRTVPNGVYFYRLDAPGFRDVKKAVVMK